MMRPIPCSSIPRVFWWLLSVIHIFIHSEFCDAEESVLSPWMIGFGKAEITPTEPVRLSGYSNRDKPFESVADTLHCRAMAISNSQDDAATMVLVSIDSIAVTAEMAERIHRKTLEAFGIPRSQLVVCATHSHAAPHVASGISNLYQSALRSDELDAIQRNTDRIVEQTVSVIEHAMRDRQKGKLEFGGDQATFAVNRRVLKNGVWSGFGIQSDGPVDHRVRVLRATDSNGKLLGAVFMYACHCTTLGGDFNQVSGDWAGLAANELEIEHAGATVLATIGCGADANPNPRTGYEDAKRHASEMVAAVNRALQSEMKTLTVFPEGHFGYAGLSSELPTREHLKKVSADDKIVNQRWSEAMSNTWSKMGRLPESYPAPIHTWQFGEDLTWVFLGGEVVVDYQMKLEKLLPGKNVWVAAYSDDVFAYVASERMRAEAGYEVDFSMIYYLQPGRWVSGTEELLLRRVREVLEEKRIVPKNRNAISAIESLKVPNEFVVDLMAYEPLIADPRGADLLINAWSSMSSETRRAACATLLQRRASIESLLTALENNSIKVRDLDAAMIQQLRTQSDRSLMARCEQVLGRPTNSDRSRIVANYLDRVNSSPDRNRGELLFKQHCSACHTPTSSKPKVGPPLDNLKHWTSSSG